MNAIYWQYPIRIRIAYNIDEQVNVILYHLLWHEAEAANLCL
jgi:hypothetical protein